MKVAFLFPGQGSQSPEFLKNLPQSPAVEKVLETASEILNESVHDLDSKEALSSTKAVQLSLLISGVAAFKEFEASGIKPHFVAGHSVGAFSAAVAAGVIQFNDAVKLVHLRGKLMEEAYPEGYGMGVVLGLDKHNLKSLVAANFDERNPVFIANQNAVDQITISGALPGIEKVLKEAGNNGARCTSLLNVSTPSHCQLMSSISEALNEALQDITFHQPGIPYVGNRNARVLSNPVDIRLDLAESVAAAVQWHDASTVLYEKGARLFIEMPPGTVLSRLASKAFPNARVLSIAENGFDDCQYLIMREHNERGF